MELLPAKISHPSELDSAGFDCVWVKLVLRSEPTPLRSPALHWLDWKLGGQISRFLVSQRPGAKSPTFLPTLKRLGFPILALEAGSKTDWKSLADACEGMKWKSVLYLSESTAAKGELEKVIKQFAHREFPLSVSYMDPHE